MIKNTIHINLQHVFFTDRPLTAGERAGIEAALIGSPENRTFVQEALLDTVDRGFGVQSEQTYPRFASEEVAEVPPAFPWEPTLANGRMSED